MPDQMEELEQRLMTSPSARARFLADTLDLLERNGVDVNAAEFQQKLQSSLDLTEGSRFIGGLVASTVVIVAASAGQRGMGIPALAFGSPGGAAASTVVVAIATARQRGIGDRASTLVLVWGGGARAGAGDAARTVVVAIATAGQRGIGDRARTVVIVAASAGQRGIGDRARTVVIVAASAGQRGLGMPGGRESMPEGGEQAVTITIPAAATVADVAEALRQLADILTNESVALDKEMGQLNAQLGGASGEPSGERS